MFKGKILIQKLDPKTGQIYTIEKEFNDPEEYQKFISENVTLFDFVKPKVYDFDNLLKYFLEIAGKKLLDITKVTEINKKNERKGLPMDIDIDFYEKELNKIKERKEKRKKEIKKLEEALDKLKKYKEEFVREKKYDIVEKIDEDIEKIIKKIKILKKNKNKK